MTTPQRTSGCKILSIASPRQASAPSQVTMTALTGYRAINLAELARAIASDHTLCCFVTEAACQEFGWPGISVEEAIVLLGRKRLYALLSSPGLRGHCASRFLRRTFARSQRVHP